MPEPYHVGFILFDVGGDSPPAGRPVGQPERLSMQALTSRDISAVLPW